MSSNAEVIRKADWALSDLESNGGLMNPEQANTFIRKLLAQPTVLGQVRRVVMSAPQRKINKISFADRILRAGVQSIGGVDTKVDLDDTTNRTRAKPTTEQIELNSREVIAEVRLPYEVIEDNIEGGNIGQSRDGGGASHGGIVDTIMTLIAERAALDLEELAILGDTGSADPYLAMVTGYLARATTHVVDADGDPVSRALFKEGMLALPSQYRRNRTALRHFVSTEQEIEYRETIANRETSLGDSHLGAGALPVYGSGAPVEGVALMPQAQGFLTHPMNLIFGIQRQIHVESAKDIRNREYIIVLTARVDFQVEETDAMVKYVDIG